MEYVIESEALSFSYSSSLNVLSDITLRVGKGEIFGLLGPNGAGKTTFVKILLDFIRPGSGNIRIFQQTPEKLDRKVLAYLPERFNVHPFLTAQEFLTVQAELAGLERNSFSHEINTVLDRVKMGKNRKTLLGNCSKGMRQRIGLAQALLGKPQLLILDEPNSGLDPTGIMDIRKIILEEKNRGTTVFINSHQLLEVEKTCDRFAILNGGRVVAEGTHAELGKNAGIEIELAEMNASVTGYLSNLDPNIRIKGNRIELFVTDTAIERQLPAKLVELGSEILLYAKKRESLEEIFLRTVGAGDKTTK